MKELNDFSKVKILVVGDVMLDRYWWGSVSRISPEAPVPVVRLKKTSLSAGGAANVAANIAGLGAQPVLFGLVGDDEEAGLIRGLLHDLSVASNRLVAVPDRPTTVKTRVIAHSQQVARVDQETDAALSPDIEITLLDNIVAMIPEVNAIVISDYAKGMVTAGLLKALISEAKDLRTPVLVDPKGKDYSKYRGATIVTPNQREAAEACNLEEGGNDLVGRAGKRLLAELEGDAVLITQGEKGMTLFQNRFEPIKFAAAARQVYDVTGAGDTVIATLATAIGAGLDLGTSTRLANIAAGIVVEQVGTSSISLSELRGAYEASRAANE